MEEVGEGEGEDEKGRMKEEGLRRRLGVWREDAGEEDIF